MLPGPFRLNKVQSGFLSAAKGHCVETPQAQVLCALGSPELFLKRLKCEGVQVVVDKKLADHDPLDAGNLFDGFDPHLPVVVTAKDWVKLRRRSDVRDWDIRVALFELRVEPEEEFRDWLIRRLDGISI